MGLNRSKNITAARRTCDKWFGIYIRVRDADPDGNIECITCDNKLNFYDGNVDCSHWIEKSIDRTRWHPHNANAACKRCNLSDNGMAAWHGKEIAAKFGKEIPNELIELSKQDTSYGKDKVMALARKFKELAEQLAQDKGIEI